MASGGSRGGGRYTFFVDVERCSGCEACVVACLDQNDLDVLRKEHAWRRVVALETPGGSLKGAIAADGRPDEGAAGAAITFVSLACMHCGDPACLLACPAGALGRDDAVGSVVVDRERCMGCHSCAIACPFGVPRYGRDGRMEKCDLCAVRVEHGLDPACVRVCPTKALRFGRENEVSAAVQQRTARRLAQGHR